MSDFVHISDYTQQIEAELRDSTAQLAALRAENERLREIVADVVRECDSTFHDPAAAMAPEWQGIYAAARAALEGEL